MLAKRLKLAGAPTFDWAHLRKALTFRLARHLNGAPFRMRNAAPMVTFTFDDVPETALTNGAAMLEAEGWRGTFYLNAGLLGTRTPDWRLIGPEGVKALALRGHEIGCHTFSHPRTDLIEPAVLKDEIARNAATLQALVPRLAIENFAYPFGVGTNGSKRLLKARFRSSRGINAGVNSGKVDLQYLKAMPLIDSLTTPAAVDAILDETVASNGWVIFYTHDVVERPSAFGSSIELFAHALRALAARGLRAMTVADALTAAGVPGGAAPRAS